MKKTGYPSIDRTHLRGIPEEKLNPTFYPLSMFATFMKINKDHLDETAVEVSHKKYTKLHVKNYVFAVAGCLLSLGLKKGDKVALILPNCYEGIIATLAANSIGIAVVMIEPSYAENFFLLSDELIAHKPKVIFAYDRNTKWIVEILTNYPFVKECLIVNSSDEMIKKTHDFSKIVTTQFNNISYKAVKAEIKKNNLTPENEPMIYLKTSGSSSGKPKTLPFSNISIFASLIYASNSTGTKTRDETVTRVLCNAPYQHGYGWMTLFVNLLGGNQVVLVGGSEKDIANYYTLSPSYIYGTPLTLKQFMASTPEYADLSCLSAFFCAGASISEEEYQEGIAYLRKHNSKAEIRNNYGISEGLCIGTASDGVEHLPGTIGKFYVGPEWLIVDEDLHEVKYGEEGEVIVSAVSLCQGYFEDEKATEESFIERDGKIFFRTGDYLSLSEDGYVRFIGRKRRFFFAKGVTDKVNCETIEQALNSLEKVSESAVIVVKDKDGVESAKAFVVPSAKYSSDYYKLKGEIFEELPNVLQSYQMPQDIVFVNSIPIMESGKINYKLLEEI